MKQINEKSDDKKWRNKIPKKNPSDEKVIKQSDEAKKWHKVITQKD